MGDSVCHQAFYNDINILINDKGQQKGEFSDKDGHFRRKDSVFRDWISKEANSKFPPEKGRYVLYANYGCPWVG